MYKIGALGVGLNFEVARSTIQMFIYQADGISMASILDKRRPCADGKFPIRIRVNWRKQQKYYSTGKTCLPETWEKLATAKSRPLLELKKEIQTSFSIIRDHVQQLREKDNFSMEALDRAILKISGETLNSLLQQKIDSLQRSDRFGTMLSYQTTLSNVIKFRGNRIPIEQINEHWLHDFEAFFLPNHSIASLGIHMRNIRAILKIAIKAEVITEKQYPFGKDKYEIKSAEGIKKALSFAQLKQLRDIELEDHDLQQARDMFLFIYYCNGINITDLINLKFKDIIDEELCFIREKTKRTTRHIRHIRIPIIPEVQVIIDRWGNEPSPDNYIFQTIVHSTNAYEDYKRRKSYLKLFNQKIQIVGAMVGIMNITSYVARHSFATALKRKGVNIAYISECLGHTSLDTTHIYLDSFEKDERMKNARLLCEL